LSIAEAFKYKISVMITAANELRLTLIAAGDDNICNLLLV
jgi:hypothetical protein